MRFRLLFIITAIVAWGMAAFAQDHPSKTLSKPDSNPGAPGKPIKVFILMGQSNMIGMGDIGPETTKGTLTSRKQTRSTPG